MQPERAGMRLSGFQLVRPRYEASQQQILAGLAALHAQAAEHPPLARLERLIARVCCGPDRIATRGFSLPYGQDAPACAGSAARNDVYEREVEAVFAGLYADERDPPQDLVHVTCTGYVSPSAAQQLVARMGWGERTRVTHAYHMGCYAAVPALRIAMGTSNERTDVVHTELCSLHFDPSVHSAEQLVVQSLFADGSARYSLHADDGDRGLRVLALREAIVGGTGDAMCWRLGDHGMRMTLSREVPERIAVTIRPFVESLFARAGLDFEQRRAACVFAVHPGGPKIIDQVRDALELREDQVEASRRVLRRFGNMSSATLPHIWADLLEDPAQGAGTLVASFGFGPGLTVCGALFCKQ
jgi:predicted naringenin-chalcone synthase